MSSPEKAFAGGIFVAWRRRSVAAVGAAAIVFRLQQGAREIAGACVLVRAGGQQQSFDACRIQGHAK